MVYHLLCNQLLQVYVIAWGVADLQREVQQLKSGPGSRGSSQAQQAQPGSLVSLDSWSQAGNNSGWDAFSNQPEDSREPTSQPPAVQSSAMSPLSPQRQAAAAQAQAFIRTQASNVQSMQVFAVVFDFTMPTLFVQDNLQRMICTVSIHCLFACPVWCHHAYHSSCT